MKRGAALTLLAGLPVTACVPVLAQSTSRSETIVGGIPVGAHVAVAIRALGMPSDVASLDTGHTWTWRTPHAELHAITDDDAIVHAVDDRPLDEGETLTVNVDGKPVRFVLRTYTVQRADADLNSIAGLSSRTSRLFDLGRNRALLLLFDDSSTLTHAVYGDRGFVARLGLITADAEMVKTLPYVAPKLRNALPASGPREAVVRYVIDRTGAIASVALEVSSQDPASDQTALKVARKAVWMPAKINNQPVRSVAFRLIAT